MKKTIIVLLFLISLLFPLSAEDNDADKLVLAVMDIEDSGCKISKDMLAKATEYLRSVFVASNKYIVVPHQNLQEKLVKIRKESHEGRYDKNFQIQLGQAVYANLILRTTLSFFATKYTLTSELIDLNKTATVKGAKVDFDNKNRNIEESLHKALDDIAVQIIGNSRGGRQSAASAKELKACQDARTDRNPGGWATYLKMYPEGECASEAKRELDRSLCEHARDKDTEEMWQKYLRLHPKGECEYEANRSILRLKHQKKQLKTGQIQSYSSQHSNDDEACNYARSENTEEVWQKYLSDYPDGECEYEANRALSKLQHDYKKEKERQIEYLKNRQIGGRIWSDSSNASMRWGDAKQYCENLSEGGFNDWILPNNNDFRARIQNNSGSVCTITNKKTGKKFKVTGDCDSNNEDSNWYWSATSRGSNKWIFNLSSGGNSYTHGHSYYYVMCVRASE